MESSGRMRKAVWLPVMSAARGINLNSLLSVHRLNQKLSCFPRYMALSRVALNVRLKLSASCRLFGSASSHVYSYIRVLYLYRGNHQISDSGVAVVTIVFCHHPTAAVNGVQGRLHKNRLLLMAFDSAAPFGRLLRRVSCCVVVGWPYNDLWLSSSPKMRAKREQRAV